VGTLRARKLDARLLITHRFRFDQILEAYETFGHAADTHALKVIIAAWPIAVTVVLSL
jgi:alcohol dehydrogenase